MLYLNAAETAGLIDRDRLRIAFGDAMVEVSAGRVSIPDRIGAFNDDPSGVMAVMPAFVPALAAMATKIVTVFPGNSSRGLPTHQAVVLLVDPSCGTLLAMLDGDVITAERTAAGSALSVDLLARADARVLTIVGTGVQARSHALAVTRVRPFDEVRIVGRSSERADALASALASEGVPAIVGDGYERAIAGADVVCATTDADEPVVLGAWVDPGTHVTSVGFSATGRELDGDLVVRASLVVESRATAFAPYPVGSHDLGIPFTDGLVDETDIHAEIGELHAGTVSGRRDDTQITLYKSAGLAAQDVAAARLVYDAARAAGIGTELT